MPDHSSRTKHEQQAGCVTSRELIDRIKQEHPDLHQTLEQHFRAELTGELRRKVEAERLAIERAAPPELKQQVQRDEKERPAPRERIRLNEDELERVRVADERREWRRAHVKSIYLHRDLLWTPPVKPYRKGGPLPGDERLLSTFEWAIACALIYEASANWRQAMHEAARSAGAGAIDREGMTREQYFRKLNDHKNCDGRHWTAKPNIAETTREVGSREYRDALAGLKRNRKNFMKVVPVTTTIGALLRCADLADTRQNRSEAEAAIKRLTKPVLVLFSNNESDFPALIKSMQVVGKELVLEVRSKWFSHHAAKILTPLARKNPTALALYLFSAVIAQRRYKGNGEVNIGNLCKRLHLTNDRWLERRFFKAVDALNEHLVKVGSPKLDIDVPRKDYIRFSRAA